jgi:hypothetical protein
MKIWGAVDAAYDTDVQVAEGDSAWIAYSDTKTIKLSATGGSKTVYCKIRDNVYNATSQLSDAITFRTSGPADAAIEIDGGAAYAVSQMVSLGLTTTDTPTTNYEMKIYGDVDAAYDADVQPLEVNAAWIAYSATKSIKLSTGDGSKTVKAKLRDADDYATSELTDAITLDTASPAVTITAGPTPDVISEQATKDTSTFTFEADTAFVEYKVKVVPTSGSAHTTGTQIPTTAGSTNMSGTGTFPAATGIECSIKGTDYKTVVSTDETYIVKVFTKDAAGNWSI